VSGARKFEAVVAAHGTRTHYRDSSHWIVRVRKLLISGCYVDHPFKTTCRDGGGSRPSMGRGVKVAGGQIDEAGLLQIGESGS